MKLLVTGGAGFIGSNFIRCYLQAHSSDKIVNLDKLTYCGNLENLSDIRSPNYTFVKGDVCNKALVNKVMRKVNVVVHFAAESHVDNSIKNSSAFIKTNVTGTNVLLEAARKNRVQKFIQVSTDEVYGTMDSGSFCEDSLLQSSSPYSASKAAADLLARAYNITYGLPVIITRSTNNFGAYQNPEKLIPHFITNLLSGKKVPLYGNGLSVRDWIYVLDNCNAIDFVLQNGEVGEIYNIGAGNEKTNLDVTRLILKHLEKDESCIEYVQDRLGHDRRYSLNCAKIHALGWKPEHYFETALAETIDWYRKNTSWWKEAKRKTFK